MGGVTLPLSYHVLAWLSKMCTFPDKSQGTTYQRACPGHYLLEYSRVMAMHFC